MKSGEVVAHRQQFTVKGEDISVGRGLLLNLLHVARGVFLSMDGVASSMDGSPIHEALHIPSSWPRMHELRGIGDCHPWVEPQSIYRKVEKSITRP